MKAFFEGGFPHICGKQSLYDILKQKGLGTVTAATSPVITTTDTKTDTKTDTATDAATDTTTETIVGFAATLAGDRADNGASNGADNGASNGASDRKTKLEHARKMYMTSQQIMGSRLQTSDYWKLDYHRMRANLSHIAGSSPQPPMNILKHLR